MQIKRFIIPLSAVGCAIPLCFGMVWLSIMCCFFLIYILAFNQLSKLKFRGKKLLKAGFLFIGLLLFSIAFRLFGFELYAIPTPSMENTILVGDKVLVSKLRHGPSLPASPCEIPWLNLLFCLDKAYGENAAQPAREHIRLSGYGKIVRGDVLVFDHPQSDHAFIKRCVGLPGDTLEIRHGRLFVNGRSFHEPRHVKMPYQVMVNPNGKLRGSLNKLNVAGKWVSQTKFEALLTTSQAEKTSALTGVYFLKPAIQEKGFDQSVFPYRNDYYHTGWSVDEYGPYVIPEKGMKIEMNVKNFHHYQELIQERDQEEAKLRYIQGKYFLDEHEIKNYVFNKDFYFFMGDNRHNSNDSRYWGPVQDDNIIGVASSVLFSNTDHEFRWDRLFKNID